MVTPTPVVALNRAIAVAETGGPGAALTLVDMIAPDLDNYHLMHAARGTMCAGSDDQTPRTPLSHVPPRSRQPTRSGGSSRNSSTNWARPNEDFGG